MNNKGLLFCLPTIVLTTAESVLRACSPKSCAKAESKSMSKDRGKKSKHAHRTVRNPMSMPVNSTSADYKFLRRKKRTINKVTMANPPKKIQGFNPVNSGHVGK